MKKLIIFDMDGVIIDVSMSYRDTSRKSVYIFFKDCIGGDRLPDPMFELSDLAFIKQGGGLNNDWDLTHRIITLLMSRVKTAEKVQGEASGQAGRHMWDVSPLAEYLRNTENPLEKLYHECGDYKSEEADFYYKGDVGSGNVIKQIFQEIYLGPEYFRAAYNFDPGFYSGDGFIHREKLILQKDLLLKLAKGSGRGRGGRGGENILAIATGRPREEALYPLKLNSLDFFKEVITLDDCLTAEAEEKAGSGKTVSFSKPHPYMLETIAEKYPGLSCYYIGDMPDDMTAAKSANVTFKAVGTVFSSPDPEASAVKLKKAGADAVAYTPAELLNII